jgi:dolichol-phosphate mannosyltransferase
VTSTSARFHVGAEEGLGQGALIVTPTYNERSNLEAFVEATLGTAPRAHLLIVDDNSPDGTGTLADEIAARDSRVRVLHRPSKLGLGTAYVAGFRLGLQGDYRYLLEMDADLSHDPADVPRLIEACANGADLALGSRYVEGGGTENWGRGRRFVSAGGSFYARTLLGVPIRDLTGGFKCFRREVLERIDLEAVHSKGYAFQIELTYRALRAGCSVVEVPIVFADRIQGDSKMSRGIFLEAVVRVPALRLAAVRGRL